MTKEVRGRRRGRPALLEGEGRTRPITVRLTDQEHAELSQEAQARGSGLSRVLYERAMGNPAPTIPAVNIEAWGRLGRVAGGLTTMAKAASIMRLDTVDRLLIEEVREELRAVRMALLGLSDAGGAP